MGSTHLMTAEDLAALPRPEPDLTIPYGPAPSQFAELRLPSGGGPHPVAVVVHGGCWRAAHGLDHIRALCAALTGLGVATWSLEYRRLGEPGGGWPGTFEDVARGADRWREIADGHGVDATRAIAVGHSAGGHLAAWLAARPRLPLDSELSGGTPLALRGAVLLGGIPDLHEAAELGVCKGAVPELLGGDPEAVPDRVRLASPAALLPLGVPLRLVHGERDVVVPIELARRFAAAARAAGDDARLQALDACGHFELIDPGSLAFPEIGALVRELLGPPRLGVSP